MLSTDQPSGVAVPFANTGLKRPIPVPSQIGITDGAASFVDGFPPKTFLPLAAGGIPPSGEDFNGILYDISNIQKWQSAGGLFKYNSAFATSVGGYPKNARLSNAANTGIWVSTVDNNLTDPDGVSPVGWVSYVTNPGEVSLFAFMTAAQVADVQARTATLDVTLPVNAAISLLRVLGGGIAKAPRGTYRLDGVAGLDTYKNGILFADTNGVFTSTSGISIQGDGVETVFRAGSTNMIVIRHSRIFSGGQNFKIEGAGLANVIGIAVAPESLTQTTEVVSQSYALYNNIVTENCVEGLLIQPGPTVAAVDSGCFYHRFYNCIWNLNTRAIWMKKDVTASGNRCTRTSFYSPIILRGNTGVQIDGGTEIDFYSPNFEFVNTGVSPSAIPTAFNYNDSNPASIRIYGGYAEQCTKAVKSISPEQVSLYGFKHNSTPDASEFFMGRYNTGRMTVPKLLNTAAYMNLGGEAFVGFVADPDQTGAKTLELQINGVQKERWASTGTNTFYGTVGNIITDFTGAGITYTRPGTIGVTTSGAGASYAVNSDFQAWNKADGTQIASLSALELIARNDNALSLGIPSLRYKQLAAVNILPGAGTAIWTSGTGTPQGVVTAPVGSMFTRTDGGANTTLYIKESGAGNTGWVAK